MRQKEGLLWRHWLEHSSRWDTKTVLIDAGKDTAHTAQALTEASFRFSEPLRKYRAGARIAFRLPNGPEWFSLFLALQRSGFAAVPLDAGMPKEGCLETAHRLGAGALYLEGNFHELESAPLRRAPCCCVKVTSGSGAQPKAVECRAEHLLADGRNVIATMGIRKSDLNLAAIPLGHSYGLGNLVMPLILQGTPMVCAAEYTPRRLIDWIGSYRVTVFPGVPALFRILAALPARGTEPLSSLRTVISAGAVLPPAVTRAFLERYGIKIHNFYGSSETGGICYDLTGGASLDGRSVGRPLQGVTVTVKAGRILVESPAVATRTGRWRLGDFGEWNTRGELVLHGRVGQGANIGGKKVHPLEVERVLRSLPGVTDAAVWSWKGDDDRELLAAAVETAQSRAQVEHALAGRLAAWKFPKTLVIARELPRNLRGKLDLAALKSSPR